MISIEPSYNAKSINDYRARDEPESVIVYVGKGFEHIPGGAEGMDRERMNSLFRNQQPDATAKNLTPRTKEGRIVGWNITLNVIKAWTVIEQLSPNLALRENMLQARIRTDLSIFQDFIEPMAQSRVRVGGYADRDSANLMAEYQTHRFSRPVKDRLSPHSHGHFFVPNATYDAARAKPGFVATKLRNAYFSVRKATHEYQKRLRAEAEKLGLETKTQWVVGWDRETKKPVMRKSWTIVGIDRETEDKFSPRRDQAMDNLEKGIPRDYAALKGRESKPDFKGFDMEAQRAEWIAMLTPREAERLRGVGPKPKWGRVPQPERERGFDFIRHVQRAATALRGFSKEGVTLGGPERG